MKPWQVFLVTCCIHCIEVILANKCFKDDAIGDREGNIYHCNSEDLPTCCNKEDGPSCCVEETTKNVKEQMQLWGTVAGMLILIGILFVCCKNDISFCKDERSIKQRWNNFRNKKSKKGEEHEEINNGAVKGQYYDNPIGEFQRKNGGHGNGIDPYHFPPLPSSRKDSMNY